MISTRLGGRQVHSFTCCVRNLIMPAYVDIIAHVPPSAIGLDVCVCRRMAFFFDLAICNLPAADFQPKLLLCTPSTTMLPFVVTSGRVHSVLPLR